MVPGSPPAAGAGPVCVWGAGGRARGGTGVPPSWRPVPPCRHRIWRVLLDGAPEGLVSAPSCPLQPDPTLGSCSPPPAPMASSPLTQSLESAPGLRTRLEHVLWRRGGRVGVGWESKLLGKRGALVSGTQGDSHFPGGRRGPGSRAPLAVPSRRCLTSRDQPLHGLWIFTRQTRSARHHGNRPVAGMSPRSARHLAFLDALSQPSLPILWASRSMLSLSRPAGETEAGGARAPRQGLRAGAWPRTQQG